MAKKIITIGKKGVTERIQGSGPISDLNIRYTDGQKSGDEAKSYADRTVGPVTSKGGPWSSFSALFFDDLTTGSVGIQSHLAGDFYDCVLFTTDWPSIAFADIRFAAGGANQGATEIFTDDISLPTRTEAKSSADNDEASFQQVSPVSPVGTISEFTSSNGIRFYGYNMIVSLEVGGLTEPDSDPLIMQKARLNVHSVSPGYSAPEFHFLPGVTSAGACLVRENLLTQEMLDNPIFQSELGGTPFYACVCGVYSVRS